MTEQIIITIIQTIFISMLVYYLQRSQNKADKKSDEHDKARHLESVLQMDLILATAKLSYACAMAHKRGVPNGEIEEGVKAYEQAKTKYYHFLNEQAKEYLDD